MYHDAREALTSARYDALHAEADHARIVRLARKRMRKRGRPAASDRPGLCDIVPVRPVEQAL